jgi:hypothetical protein
MRAHKVNSAILQCLEHVATCTSPPGAGAADFLLRLMDHDVFSVDELDEISLKVATIINGILERGVLSAGQHAPGSAEGLSAARKSAARVLSSASRVAGEMR